MKINSKGGKSLKNETLVFKDNPSVDKSGKPILGNLTGPCADFTNPTRNGRLYNEELWSKVFDSPLIKEQFENGGLLGELGHPESDEVNLEKVCVCMPEAPIRDNNGKLVASFDVLDTPCGRILKTLCDYGYKIGVSSRGNGDLETDFNGQESVIPDSYTLVAFDVVALPSVKAARMQYSESLDQQKSLHQALTEALNSSSDKDKVIMTEVLNDLDLTDDSQSDEIVNINSDNETVAVDDGSELVAVDTDVSGDTTTEEMQDSDSLLTELQISLEAKLALESKVTELNNKLSALYAKVSMLTDELSEKDNLLTNATSLADTVPSLEESLNNANAKLSAALENNKKLNSVNSKLQEQVESAHNLMTEAKQTLQESLSALKDTRDRNNEMSVQLDNEKKLASTAKHTYQEKLISTNKLLESYKGLATKAVNKYIDSKASALGVSIKDIKTRLSESYTLEEVDCVCDSLREYKVNISSLPFSISQDTKVKITESKKPISGINPAGKYDDNIDEGLFDLLTN